MFYDGDNRLRFIYSNRDNLHVQSNSEIYIGDRVHRLNNVGNAYKDKNGYLYVTFTHDSLRRTVAISYDTGKLVKLPRNIRGPLDFSIGCFFYLEYKPEKRANDLVVYTTSLRKVKVFTDVKDYAIDNIRKDVIILGKDNTIAVYEFDPNSRDYFYCRFKRQLPAGYRILNLNNWVVSLCHDDEIVYCSSLGIDQLYSFKNKNMDPKLFAYSEGLYNCVNENGFVSYRNLSGNSIIETELEIAGPFLGNIALAVSINEDKTQEYGFIDRTGRFISKRECFAKAFQNKEKEMESVHDKSFYWIDAYEFLKYIDTYKTSVRPNFAKGKYEICRQNSKKGMSISGYLDVRDYYTIDDDTPIIDINFGSNDKGDCFKKGIL